MILRWAEDLLLSCMDTGIADEIISCEISERKSLLYLSGASSGIERGPVNVRVRV